VDGLRERCHNTPDQWSFIRTDISCQSQRYRRMKERKERKERKEEMGRERRGRRRGGEKRGEGGGEGGKRGDSQSMFNSCALIILTNSSNVDTCRFNFTERIVSG